jgi:hypothetical protein
MITPYLAPSIVLRLQGKKGTWPLLAQAGLLPSLVSTPVESETGRPVTAQFRRVALSEQIWPKNGSPHKSVLWTGVDLVRLGGDRVDRFVVLIVERDVGVCPDDGFDCCCGAFGSAARGARGVHFRDERAELV